MIKEEKLVFRRVILFVIVILLVSMGMFLYRYGFSKGLTGFSIRETVSEAYTSISPISKIFLISQWCLLALVLLLAFMKDKGIKIRKNEITGINLKKASERRGTDLDTLYNILKKKKQLRVSTISKLFKVKKEVAMNWCKILESGNLAVIDYPSSREPIIKIISK